ncbi:hypothetical protein L211DRAFT_846659 [Terfezia boudieri ATCC MYA-4762]|uniref:Uncharacterized protein n=1 Tax=Terfezia boudieri ATCC MYA-4762 TaxID=1051890 RepID=A0A3N4LZK7_9PEZI|nr:hypothetical protein L211DRAFT_846659 [Terfezia boudieri ATCC MYA-4762]
MSVSPVYSSATTHISNMSATPRSPTPPPPSQVERAFTWSPTPAPSTQQPTQPVKQQRVHYTPELKLQLIRLCINSTEQFCELNAGAFWQYIAVLFQQKTGNKAGDLRKKVSTLITEREAVIRAHKLQSGVAVAAPTDLDQALDEWMEIIERRNEERKGQEADDIKREKAASEIKRENLLHTLSKKRTFNAVMDARNTVDLTHPGDVVIKRRQIRENLRESTNKAEFYESLLRIMDEFKTGILSALNKPSSQPSSEVPPAILPPAIPPLATSAEVTQLHNRLSRLEDILEKLVSEISKGKD